MKLEEATINCLSKPQSEIKEYTVTPLGPIVFFESATLLRAVHYGNAMLPTLKSGDLTLFRKRDISEILEDSEIYMIQYGEADRVIVGRLQPGKLENLVCIKYDNPEALCGVKGQDLEKKHIIGIWELVSSTRHFKPNYSVNLPVFENTKL